IFLTRTIAASTRADASTSPTVKGVARRVEAPAVPREGRPAEPLEALRAVALAALREAQPAEALEARRAGLPEGRLVAPREGANGLNSPTGYLRRAPLDGGAASALWVTASHPSRTAVFGGYAYVSIDTAIERVALDGGVNVVFASSSDVAAANALMPTSNGLFY